MDIKRVLKSLSEDDIINFMDSLGADVSNITDEQIVFTSICHNSRSKKLYYYKQSFTFYCYSRCGKIGNLVDLIIHINECDFKNAINYIKKFFGHSKIHTLKKGIKRKYNPNRQTINNVQLNIDKHVHDNPYIYLLHKEINIKEWEEEGISFEAIKEFNIRYDICNEQILIPHFCSISNGNIPVGIRCRETMEEKIDKFGKYHPYYYKGIMYNHKLSNELYGLNFNRENIKKYKKAIIFEGEKSILQYETMYPGYNICLALCGSNMSLYQKKLLIDLGIKQVVFALDKQYQNEEEKQTWKSKQSRMALELIQNGIECYMLLDDIEGLTEYKDSPLDKGKETFLKLIQNKIKIEGDMNEI